MVDAVSATLAALEAAFFTSATRDARAETARRALTGALARAVRAVVLATANIVLCGSLTRGDGMEVAPSEPWTLDPQGKTAPRRISFSDRLFVTWQAERRIGRVNPSSTV